MLIQFAAALLAPIVSVPEEEIAAKLEYPPNPRLGDISFPCFSLAKLLRKAPVQIAEQLAAAINEQDIDVHAKALNGYVNLFLNRAAWSYMLLATLNAPAYGQLKEGEGKLVLIDMSSPNIAKPFGIGHLRSTMIGNALMNLYRAAGYEVQNINHIGDWGTQFGKMITAYKRWGNKALLEQTPIEESLRLYVQFHEEAEQHPELNDEAREWFRRLELGDEEALQLWQFFVTHSMEEFNRVYDRLGISFDHVLGESFYNNRMNHVVEQLQQLQLLEESDGAQVVRLDNDNLPPCLILKSDGSTIYPTRDLAAAYYRKQVMGANRVLYVVGAEQSLHFQQVIKVLSMMGEEWDGDYRHIPFGLMLMNGKKMSTRRGKVVLLNEVLDEAVRKAVQILDEKSPDLPNKTQVAEAIGVGAIIFGDLKNRRMLEVDFRLEEAISFDGETGPYVQYTYARASSLLRKGAAASIKPEVHQAAAEFPEHVEHEVWQLIKLLAQYEDAIREALREHEPAVMARYLLDTAKQFNRFYNKHRIISDDPHSTSFYLSVTATAANIFKKGLALLGIQTPEQI